MVLNISLVTKILKKLDLYANSVNKWLYITEILMKIDICFLIKEEKVFIKIMKILEKIINIIKKQLW